MKFSRVLKVTALSTLASASMLIPGGVANAAYPPSAPETSSGSLPDTGSSALARDTVLVALLIASGTALVGLRRRFSR
jgi:LPXTG-motif cell wall-anchored protein